MKRIILFFMTGLFLISIGGKTKCLKRIVNKKARKSL